MKFFTSYFNFFSVKLLSFLVLFFSFSILSGQIVKPQIVKNLLRAEVILQNELNLKKMKRDIIKHSTVLPEDTTAFKEFVLSEYGKDKEKFITEFSSGKFSENRIPSYFSFLRAKYNSLYTVFLTQKNTDEFSLFYNKGIHTSSDRQGNGNNDVMGPGQPCDNTDFEQCNFNSWDLYSGDVPGNVQYSYSNVNPIAPGTQHIISNAGTDPVVPIPMLYPDGGACSVRLGDGANTGAKGASMKQTFLVDSNNAVFTYSYAAVLEDGGHPSKEQPYFRVKVYDSGNNSIPCGEYNVNAGPVSSGGDPSFLTQGGYQYKDWTTVFAPLNGYIGQNVTVEFIVGDCSQGGHAAWAYVESACMPLEIIASSPVICGGQTVTLTAPPGAATYSWSGPNSFTANTQTINTSTPGTYNVVVTPVSGSACAITLTTILPANPSIPVANFSASSPCIGNPTSFTDLSSVSPGTIDQWNWDFGISTSLSDTSTSQNPVFIYTVAGNYNVNCSVTTSDGCVKDTTLTVNVIPGFDATFTPDTFCNDEPPLNLTPVATGGTWSGTGITNAANGTFNPANAGIGTFPITYTGGTGVCTDTYVNNIIVVGVAITNVLAANASCFGANDGTLTITATGASQYTIDNGSGPIVQSNGNFTGLTPGTYSITIASAINNCQKTSTATITEPPVFNFAFLPADVKCYNACDGSAIVVPSGGTSPYTYLWNTGAGNVPLSNGLCAGTYAITVNDLNNCTKDTSFIISQPNDYFIDVSTVNSNCGHPDGSAQIDSISGQTSPYNYLWSNDSVSSIASNIVNGNYSLTITDFNNCDTVLYLLVDVNPPPSAAAVSTKTSCYGICDGSATVIPSGGNPPGQYTFAWSDNQSTDTASGLCAGSYTVIVYDAEMCEGYASVIVDQPEQVMVSPFPEDTICIDSAGTLGANTTGGTPPYTYLWDNGSTDSVNAVYPSSQTCYTVSATDANGCVSNPEVQCISLYPTVFVLAMGSTTICEGEQAEISVYAYGGNPNNIITYSWSNGSTNEYQTLTPPGDINNPVNYSVTATDGCAPPVTDFVTIDFHLQPEALLVADDTEGCEPVPEFAANFSNISNNLNNPTSCYWTIEGSDPIESCNSFLHLFPNAGTYDVGLTVVSEDGCLSKITMPDYITVHPNPVADFSFTPQPTDVQRMNITFADLSTGDSINQWQWSFFDNNSPDLVGSGNVQNPVFNFSSSPDNPFIYYLSDTGYYPVTLWIQTNKGCLDSVKKTVKIDAVYLANLPNAFTPNDDGINDYFFPSGVGIHPYEEFRFLIFDRWGDIIFESKSLDDPWDGTARSLGGKILVKQDVYVWTLELIDLTPDRVPHKKMGHVTLLK